MEDKIQVEKFSPIDNLQEQIFKANGIERIYIEPYIEDGKIVFEDNLLHYKVTVVWGEPKPFLVEHEKNEYIIKWNPKEYRILGLYEVLKELKFRM